MPSDKKSSKKAALKKPSSKPEKPPAAAGETAYHTDPATGFIVPGNCPPLLNYYAAVQTRFSGLRILTVGSYAHDRRDLHIDDLFVTPSLTEIPVSLADAAEGNDCGKNLIRELKDHRRLVILGDPGAGKTTLVNWLAWSLTSTETHREINRLFANHIPIPLILRETKVPDFRKGDKEPTLEKIFEVFTTQLFATSLRDHVPLLINLFKRGQLFFLFDGIDELSPAKTDWLQQAWFTLCTQPSDKACPGVLTSRIVGYESKGFELYALNKEQLDLWLSFEKPDEDFYQLLRNLATPAIRKLGVEEIQPSNYAGLATRRYVAPFDKDRINSFARSWYKLRINDEKEAAITAEKFLKSLAEHASLRELRHSPLLLTFMALVYLVREKLPDGRALLYREITDAYLDKLRSRTSAQVSSDDVRKALFHLAWEAQKLRDKSEDNSKEEADSGILIPEKLVIKTFGKVFEGEGEKFVHKLLDDCKHRTGLLIPRGKVGNEEHYAFAHLSFQEYFASQRLLTELGDEWSRWQHEAGEFSRDSLVKLASRVIWHETFVLVFESLSAQTGAMKPAAFAGFLFDARMDLKNPYDTVIWSKKPEELSLPDVPVPRNRMDSVETSPQRHLMELLVALTGDSRITFENRLLDSIILHLIPLLPALDPFRTTLSYRYFFGYVGITNSVVSSPLLGKRFFELLPQADSQNRISELNLGGCKISQISFLAKFTSLKALSLEDTEVAELSPLTKLTALQHLRLDSTQIKDLSPLAKLPNLESLEMDSTPVADLSPLAMLTSLQTLSISGTQVTDLSPLHKLATLQTLRMHGTQVTDISPLVKLTSLESLSISGTQVADLSPLAKLTSLRFIHLAETRVEDLSPLSGLKKLEFLAVPEELLEHESAAELRKALPNLKIHSI